MNVKYSLLCNEAFKNRQIAMFFCNDESKIDVEKLVEENEITCEEVTEETIKDIMFKDRANNFVYDYSIDYEVPVSESAMSFEESDEEICEKINEKLNVLNVLNCFELFLLFFSLMSHCFFFK